MLDGIGANGPIGIQQSSDPELDLAAKCGATCGVSRVADLTFLDVLNIPVCQAVRPWSRALSVHQGKGLTRRDAWLGALMEAVESCAAEQFEGETRHCSFDELPCRERAPVIEDFASGKAATPSGRVARAWTPARLLSTGARLWVPFECVSLDLTFRGDPGLDRSSNGQASGFSVEQATLTALCELLERDAMCEWRTLSPVQRALDSVDLESLPSLPWLDGLRATLADRGMSLRLFATQSLVGWPVLHCLIEEPRAFPCLRWAAGGQACRPRMEDALRAAVLEAVQSRLTAISGARDDILPDDAPRPAAGFVVAPPLPRDIPERSWGSIEDHEDAGAEAVAVAATRLANVGYDVVVVDLPTGSPAAVAVKAYAPGLGGEKRRRRAA
jgi:ribosomal protein S12 methylthiotransferase accessory factor